MDDKDIGFALSVRSDDLSPKAADYIARLEEVVRAVDALHQDAQVVDERFFFGVNVHKDIWEALKAARSRVNLPPVTSQSQPEGVDPFPDRMEVVHDGFGDNFVRCGKDCSAHFARPGVVQCNGDGLKCPNKEASDGLQAKQS